MEVVPVFYLSKTYHTDEVNPLYLRNIMKKHEFKDLYVIDEQGIKRNEPQYEFYQRFSSMFNLWVDTGPRDIDDVVDDIFSGAKRIIIRLNLWKDESLSKIRDLSDHEIFIAVDGTHIEQVFHRSGLYEDADGFILFMKSDKKQDFKNDSLLNQLIKNKRIYIFDEKHNESMWESKEIKGILKDVNIFV